MLEKGKLPAVPAGRGSFCDGAAVARAHVAAVKRGRTGENYLLGGPTATFRELVETIASLLHKAPPKRTIPTWLLRVFGEVGRAMVLVSDREPFLTPEMVEGLIQEEVADSSKAIRELGYETPSLRAMLEGALAWYREEGLMPKG
jgi:nucleoside-diphosphate-sugar epimerase